MGYDHIPADTSYLIETVTLLLGIGNQNKKANSFTKYFSIGSKLIFEQLKLSLKSKTCAQKKSLILSF